MKIRIITSLMLTAATLFAEQVIVTIPEVATPATSLQIVYAKSQSDFDQIAMQFGGTRPGSFPALIDKRTGLWVQISETVAAAQTNLLVLLQAAKSLEQKTAENAFFALTETILTAVEDPRAGQTPPVKLSFSEINALIKTIQATDPMAAINFSLELLAVDAELKRFDTLWWDRAATHTIQE